MCSKETFALWEKHEGQIDVCQRERRKQDQPFWNKLFGQITLKLNYLNTRLKTAFQEKNLIPTVNHRGMNQGVLEEDAE